VVPIVVFLAVIAGGAAARTATGGAAAPTVTSIAPTTAANTGPVTLSVTGAGFDTRGRVSARLEKGTIEIRGSAQAPREDQALAKFDLTGVAPGVYEFVFVNGDGKEGTLSGAFTVTGASAPKPQIVRLSPASGKRKAKVTITGTGFGATRDARLSFVKFGAKKCSVYLSWTDTLIKCKVPAKAAFGKVKVSVTAAAGVSNTKTFKVKRP
jgi:hypothetical protein